MMERKENVGRNVSLHEGTLVGLPVEVWGLIVDLCPVDDAPSLSATCVVLRFYTHRRMRQCWTATRDSVDAFASKWQKETARCDRWSLWCGVCPYGMPVVPSF